MADQTAIEWTADNITRFVFKRGAMVSGKKAERWAISSPEDPLRWRKPRHVELRSDLFHEDVPDEWIDKVFAVMALAPRHTFQVLTKRPKRMRGYFHARRDGDPWAEAADYIADLCGMEDHAVVLEPSDIPLPNVWLGTSVEDQPTADERIPHLLETPAAVRFVSAEPLLGPVDLNNIHRSQGEYIDALWCEETTEDDQLFGGATIDWVIAGGESGPGARPMHPEWARSLRDQCAAAEVPFFLKQWGAWALGSDLHYDKNTACVDRSGRTVPAPARASDFPTDATRSGGWSWMRRVGKSRAVRLLDGVEHNGMPEVAAR